MLSHLPPPPLSTDVNECLHSELHACSEGEQCLNTEGSYQCVATQQLNPADEGNAGVLRWRENGKEAMSRVDGLQTSATPAGFL